MTDKELLVLAAKGSRLVLWGTQDDEPGLLAHGGDKPVRWNPLEDDGDALRVAVILRLSIKNTEVRASVLGPDWIAITEPHGEDACAATRRAIVRAAAGVGALHNAVVSGAEGIQSTES